MTVSRRFKEALREQDTVARVGGDEFAAVLEDLSTEADLPPLIQRLLNAASQPITSGDAVTTVSASIGVAVYAQDSPLSAEQLLHQADQAMYRAKTCGKNRYCLEHSP